MKNKEVKISDLRKNCYIKTDLAPVFKIFRFIPQTNSSIVLDGYKQTEDGWERKTIAFYNPNEVVTRIPFVKITKSNYLWLCEIQPIGYWSDIITVRRESKRYGGEEWKEPEVSHGSGGIDGTLSSIETAENFRDALDYAINTAKEWAAK